MKSFDHTVSEERVGIALEAVMDKMFFAAKSSAQTKDQALNQLAISLNKLRTDYLDVHPLHGVSTQEGW